MVSSTAMSGTHEDRQYIPAMKLMWDEVDARFDPKYVLGEAGHRFCQTYSVRAAQSRIALRSALFVNDVCSGQGGSCCFLSHIPIASDSRGHQCELCPNEKIVHDRTRRNPGASVGCCHPEGSGINKIGRKLARAGSARWIARWAFRKASKAGLIHFSSMR